MKKYYVNENAQGNGDHEVHHEYCRFLPDNRRYLGEHPSCATAVDHAKLYHHQVNGCKACSPDCNTQ